MKRYSPILSTNEKGDVAIADFDVDNNGELVLHTDHLNEIETLEADHRKVVGEKDEQIAELGEHLKIYADNDVYQWQPSARKLLRDKTRIIVKHRSKK